MVQRICQSISAFFGPFIIPKSAGRSHRTNANCKFMVASSGMSCTFCLSTPLYLQCLSSPYPGLLRGHRFHSRCLAAPMFLFFPFNQAYVCCLIISIRFRTLFDTLHNVCRSMTDGWSPRQRSPRKKSKGSQLLRRVYTCASCELSHSESYRPLRMLIRSSLSRLQNFDALQLPYAL